MSSVSPPSGDFEEELWELEDDLPSLANQAAIELDNLLLGRDTGFEAVQRLASRLAADVANGDDSASTAVHYDPITLSVVNRAIDEWNPATRPEKISDVVKYVEQLTKRLEGAAKSPQSASREELEELRDHCVVLSESASVSGRPPFDNDPRYPFGR